MTNKSLMEAAIKARDTAYADISGFKVGAALLDKEGRVFTGCNIEDPSGIGITNICAERCAIIKALSEGSRSFVKIAIAGGKDELTFCAPCGACRQYLNSWCPQVKILLMSENVNEKSIKEYDLSELLPYSFNL